jgi:hypothetical protein
MLCHFSIALAVSVTFAARVEAGDGVVLPLPAHDQ